MRALIFALICLAVIPACGQQTMRSAVGTLEVKAAVDSLWSGYAHASDRKDAAAFGALFTEDAALVYTGVATVRGRQAVQERLVSMYADIDPTGLRVEADETRVSGTMAIQTGTFEESFNEKSAAKTRFGRFALIAESERERSWKIRRLFVVVDSTVAQ
ncbi:MAG TPA: SgcJ/EcaC family oxidoreductase [Candidatus Eisenbacteria bacterium]|nr:SgcJ/EcaC family oxidoreductase [Candidatus Eisenbacteria bacterium]